MTSWINRNGRLPLALFGLALDWSGQTRDYLHLDRSLFRNFFECPVLEANFRMLGVPYRSLDGVYSVSSDPEGADHILDPKDWKAFNLSGQDLGQVLQDGDLTTGFNTVGPDPDGQGLLLDLGGEALVGGFALVPQDFQDVPAGLKIETAGLDKAFQVIREDWPVKEILVFGPNGISTDLPWPEAADRLLKTIQASPLRNAGPAPPPKNRESG